MKLLALAALPACDVVFGIAAVPPALEVNHGHVTIQYSWTVATQTATGPTLATGVAAPDNYLDVRAELLDGTRLAVTQSTPTTFELTLPPGATYVLRTQAIDDETPTEYETAAAAMNLVDYRLDRYHPTPAALPIPIAYTVTYPALSRSGDYPLLVALGARTLVPFDGGAVDAPALSDWRHAVTTEGVHGPLLSTSQFSDRFVLQRWTTDLSTQWIDSALVDPVEMVDGQPIVRGAAGAELAVPELALDSCATLDARRLTEQQRLVDLTKWTDNPATGWNISSTTSFDTPPAYTLALVANYTATADDLVDAKYGHPYPGEVDIAVLGANVQKQLAVPGTAAPTTLYAGMSLITAVPPSTAVDCVPVSFTSAGIATEATIAGQPLTTHAQEVMIDRSQRVPFDVTIGGGPWDDVRVALFEVYDDNGSTNLRRQMAYQISSDPPSASIDPTLLVEGHYYVLQFNTRVGFPRSRQLDLSVVQYPYANTTSYSQLFKIVSN